MAGFREVLSATMAILIIGSPAPHEGKAAEVEQNVGDLRQAVLNGNDIRIVLDLARCTDKDSKPGPSVQGLLHPDGYMIEPDRSIGFSVTHFSVRDDNGHKGPVQEFLSFRVSANGKVIVRNVFLTAPNDAIFKQDIFACEVGNGVSFHW